MSQTKPQKQPSDLNTKSSAKKATPIRCFFGTVVSGGLAFGLYSLMSSIVQTYATKPVVADNLLVLRITVAVRTLVIGVAALGAGVFAFVALGLMLLGIQLTIQSLKEVSS
ncbi:hypothetical protein Sta7437_2460 [Stanieria cyanosphaera PCC 7437]|uniref:DUF3082 domain-containing protein n=1 Tax=Stanieria cyanosphaera (strain ATCC 29371 / PCC 7437) TaxID=111780 RepID=K9XV98_STAC7|nr:DUF3082 domain-containing protein [Stanieria cyanosphaera]AFZ35994.1 hypothetical protein Sta7437_2460 [Stanieria cyanosphaera PCC 7437]